MVIFIACFLEHGEKFYLTMHVALHDASLQDGLDSSWNDCHVASIPQQIGPTLEERPAGLQTL
jgi:hypothetical protein